MVQSNIGRQGHGKPFERGQDRGRQLSGDLNALSFDEGLR